MLHYYFSSLFLSLLEKTMILRTEHSSLLHYLSHRWWGHQRQTDEYVFHWILLFHPDALLMYLLSFSISCYGKEPTKHPDHHHHPSLIRYDARSFIDQSVWHRDPHHHHYYWRSKKRVTRRADGRTERERGLIYLVKDKRPKLILFQGMKWKEGWDHNYSWCLIAS